MAEVPWWSSPPDAKLHWVDDEIAILVFPSPEPGNEECRIAVTLGSSDGPTRWIKGHEGSTAMKSMSYYGWVWHIDRYAPNNIATVSPSIHFHNHFHSPNPVQFRLVEITRGR